MAARPFGDPRQSGTSEYPPSGIRLLSVHLLCLVQEIRNILGNNILFCPHIVFGSPGQCDADVKRKTIYLENDAFILSFIKA